MKTDEAGKLQNIQVSYDDIRARVLARYFMDCDALGYIRQQPGCIDVNGDTVTLANIHGVLATYRYRANLRGVRFQLREVGLD